MAVPEAGDPGSTTLPRTPPRRRWRHGLLALGVLCAGVGAWHTLKPLPPGLHVQADLVVTPDASLRFLADVTVEDGAGGRILQREIHAATLELVHAAQDLLVLDYFLFNGQGGPAGAVSYDHGLAPVSAELLAALRTLRQSQPQLPILLVTDPINDYYRGTAPAALESLRALQIDVVVTRLSALRDSNPLYSAVWRTLFGWWLPTRGEGWLPNLLDGDGPGLKPGALLRLPNFKANHRKLVITGDGNGSLVGIIASANPHDASSAHSNVALRVAGEALRPLLASELEVARFSGWTGGALERLAAGGADAARAAQVQAAAVTATTTATATAGEHTNPAAAAQVGILTEGAIRDALLHRFGSARAGDAIDVAQFYLAERRILQALLAAARRGVAVRVLLDPNRDAFGFEKSGIPNRPLGNALLRDSDGRVALRWYRTSGEQFHAKYASVRHGERLWFTLGSANFTRRNIGDLNLEANVEVDAPVVSVVARDAAAWFETLWSNAGGIAYTDPADTWAEHSRRRYWQSRLMEASGLSTF